MCQIKKHSSGKLEFLKPMNEKQTDDNLVNILKCLIPIAFTLFCLKSNARNPNKVKSYFKNNILNNVGYVYCIGTKTC